MPSETIRSKVRLASNFKTRKNSKAPYLHEKSNPDVWDPKATRLQMSSAPWSEYCCQLQNGLSAGKDSGSHISVMAQKITCQHIIWTQWTR